MNGVISTTLDQPDELQQALAGVPDMDGLELSSKISTTSPYNAGNPEARIRIAVMDFGVKKHILQCLVERGAYITVFPATATVDEMAQFEPHGYFLSNGPGDPAAMPYAVRTTSDILATNKPTFGICLGHQLLARANGIATYKMHHGHRGLNHPVKNLLTGKCEITTQNHGFGVHPEDVKNCADVEVTHINLNDHSIEGIRMTTRPAFSVQYHPESTPGSHDSRYLFDQFLSQLTVFS
jgi:carbamoyl-phosphate synthase small subunit